MKQKTQRLLSAVLSATTIMSMLTAVTASATDSNSITTNADDVVTKSTMQGQLSDNQQTNTAVSIDDNTITNSCGSTGDRTGEYGISDDATVINSASEYYKLTGKKCKVPSGGSLKAGLPSSVDNSQSVYFPPIGNQGQIGSCVAWAQVYYQFTYEMNKLQGIPTTPENTFSPKWTYNLLNAGMDWGSTSDEVYGAMHWQGVAPMSLVPYDDDYCSWMPTEEVWSTALKYKIKDYQYFDDLGLEDTRITSANDSDLEAIKTALSNGDVLTYSTFIYSWKTTRLKMNPDVPENDKYVGNEVVTGQYGYDGAHRMALVGYNDNIWTDINNNDQVDEGEMGAFKVANSWDYDYGNLGYMWIAYDALNKDYSSVESAPEYEEKYNIFEFVARVDVEPTKDNSDMYLRCTLNTSSRSDMDVYLIGEKNGTVYQDTGLAVNKYPVYAGSIALDGSDHPSDGTLAFALNNIAPDINSEDFYKYNWSVKFVDEAYNFAALTVKDVAIVDSGENKIYKPQNFTPFTLNADEKTIDITSSTANDIVIYYVGYYNPTLHYKTDNGQWQTAQMEKNPELYGYTHKFVIPSDEATNATLYFSDVNGDVDDNNGNYYRTDGKFNHYKTENQAKPLSANVTIKNKPDVGMYMDYIATAEGGYAPYRYEFVLTNLDDGTQTIREYEHEDMVNWKLISTGVHRITVNVKDQSNNVVTASVDFNVEDKPFVFTSLTANPDKHIMTGDTVEFKAMSEYESAVSWGAEPSMYDFIIRKADTNEVVYSICKRADESDFYTKYSINYISWVPQQAGDYTLTVSSTDNNQEYAEKVLEFTVAEYNGTIIGDADNNGTVNITDALMIMKYNIGGLDDSQVWLRLTDVDDDSKVNLRDAIYILKYIVSGANIANVGKVNYREIPAE